MPNTHYLFTKKLFINLTSFKHQEHIHYWETKHTYLTSRFTPKVMQLPIFLYTPKNIRAHLLFRSHLTTLHIICTKSQNIAYHQKFFLYKGVI